MYIKKDVPFVPSSKERLVTMIQLAEIVPGQKAVDLGSGDGQVVIEMARLGALAFGYEIDPNLVEKSLKNIEEAGLAGQAFIVNADYWDETLEQFEIVTIYGITGIMKRLENKLKKELKPGTKVISNFFTFPNWKPVKIQGDIYLYMRG